MIEVIEADGDGCCGAVIEVIDVIEVIEAHGDGCCDEVQICATLAVKGDVCCGEAVVSFVEAGGAVCSEANCDDSSAAVEVDAPCCGDKVEDAPCCGDKTRE